MLALTQHMPTQVYFQYFIHTSHILNVNRKLVLNLLLFGWGRQC